MPALAQSVPDPAHVDAHGMLVVCPGCGQHIDPANIRCPRCRRWFVEPPSAKRRSRLALGIGIGVIAFGAFVAGMMMQWMWTPLPQGVVVPEEPGSLEQRQRVDQDG